MGCSDGREPISYHNNQEIRDLQVKVDKLTRLLCAQCKRLEASPDVKVKCMTAEVSKWWVDHQIDDNIRNGKIKKQIADLDAQKAALQRQLEE